MSYVEEGVTSKSKKLLDELDRYVIADPWPFVVNLAQSNGMYLATIDGRSIFDWAGYYGAKLIAHNHPRLYEAGYVERLIVAANNKVSNPDFLTPECVAYYRELYALAPKSMRGEGLEVYAVNSGAEAVENMMKYFINLHHHRLLATGKITNVRRFVYFDQAFHGRTVFALNITNVSHDPLMTKDFQGLVAGNIQVPFPAVDNSRSNAEQQKQVSDALAIIENVFRQHGDEIVGLIAEPLQGAGGHRIAPPDFFPRLMELCYRYQVQIGFDEVQTAGGTTGTFFAIDAFDLPGPPGAVATGKKLGNGVVYMQKSMKDRGILDSTWGGTLSDMVRFVQEMSIVRSEKLIEQIPAKAESLVQTLEALANKYPEIIYNVRGYGIYQGFSLKDNISKEQFIAEALEKENLLLLGAGANSIRLRPHLHVNLTDIVELGYRLDRLCEGLSERS